MDPPGEDIHQSRDIYRMLSACKLRGLETDESSKYEGFLRRPAYLLTHSALYECLVMMYEVHDVTSSGASKLQFIRIDARSLKRIACVGKSKRFPYEVKHEDRIGGEEKTDALRSGGRAFEF